MSAIQSSKKQDQLKNIQNHLEKRIANQEKAIQKTQINKPPVLSMPSTKNTWQKECLQQTDRLKELHDRLERVKVIGGSVDAFGKKIDHMASKKMRFENPVIAEKYDESKKKILQERKLVEVNTQTQKNKKSIKM